jgi:hypothetical protein
MASLLRADRFGEPRLDVGDHGAAEPGLVTRAFSALLRRGAFYRRAMAQSTVIGPWSDRRYAARLARHADRMPALAAPESGIVAEMRERGVAVRDIDPPADVLACADRLTDVLRHRRTGEPCAKATPAELAVDPTLFLFGLTPNMLDVAECHLGLPARYLGLEVKRELIDSADGGKHETVRRWHLDHEDRRMFKVIVYLSDVDDTAGPFGYVERSNTERIRLLAKHHHDAVSDDDMSTVVPREDWQRATGPRLTAVYADTGQVFHRVFPPTATERYSVTFAYSSRSPYYTYSRLMLPRRALRQLRSRLTTRQWNALGVRRIP